MSALRRFRPVFAFFALASCEASSATPLVDAGTAADAPAVTDAPATDAPATDAPAADVPVDAGPATRCAAITASVQSAGFDDRVTVRCDERYAYLVSDTYTPPRQRPGSFSQRSRERVLRIMGVSVTGAQPCQRGCRVGSPSMEGDVKTHSDQPPG